MNNKKLNISLGSILFKSLAMLFITISVTFSWFVFTKDTDINSIISSVTKAGSVSISKDGEIWGSKLELNIDSGNLTITEYSGNGDYLYLPIIEGREVIGYFLPNDTTVMSSPGYLEAKVIIKTDIPIHLYLSQESTISPVDLDNPLDYIAGALRVSIIAEGQDPFIWAPNATYQLNDDGTVNPNGQAESKYSYVKNNNINNNNVIENTEENLVIIDNSEQNAFGVSDDKRFVWGNLLDIDNYEYEVLPIFSTDKELTGVLQKEITIRIWVEGTDREAVSSLLGGKFNIKLSFLAVGNN